jgi:hypothetical protein
MPGLFEKEEKKIGEGVESFYNRWAGQVGEFRGAKLDQYNNPVGEEYDLAKPMAFEGFFIVIFDPENDELPKSDIIRTLCKSLEGKGFSYVIYTRLPEDRIFEKDLEKACIFLLALSHMSDDFTTSQVQLIATFFEKGGGLYLFTDNTPWLNHANSIIRKLWSSSHQIYGNENGGRVLPPQQGGGKNSGFIKHLITTGLSQIHEGITISVVPEKSPFKAIMWSSSNTIAIGYVDADKTRGRVVLDTGFTKLMPQFWNQTAGTSRYIGNAVCWLVNIERYLNFQSASFKLSMSKPKNIDLGKITLKKGERKLFGKQNLKVSDLPDADLVSEHHFSIKFFLKGIIFIQNLGVFGLIVNQIPIGPNKIIKVKLPCKIIISKKFNFDVEEEL